MARLTDSNGALLGGLEMPLARLLASLNGAQAAPICVPASPPTAPAFGPGEVVFALHCAYGTFPSLGYSAASQAANGIRRSPRRWGCDSLIEEPEERHFCPACGGYYCLDHADAAAHQCRSIRRSG